MFSGSISEYVLTFCQVHKKRKIPIWAIALTTVTNALLGLINVGSTVAFNAVVSLVVAG
jgi:choline transport protein